MIKMPKNPDNATNPITDPGNFDDPIPSRRIRKMTINPARPPPRKFVSRPVLASPMMIPARLVIED